MGEAGSSPGIGVWSDDLTKYCVSCEAGQKSQEAHMKFFSWLMSKRDPALVDGEISDMDVCAALAIMWPIIAYGGLNRHAGRQKNFERKVLRRVEKFIDGKWTPWLNDIASNLEHGTKQV